MKLVIDTNVFISALVKNSFTREFILNTNSIFELIAPAYLSSEISKYKEEISKKANLHEKQFYLLLVTLLKYVLIVNPVYYNSYLNEADKIIGYIDKKDVPFIAVALVFNCPIWSDDKHFKKQKQVKILTTKNMANLIS